MSIFGCKCCPENQSAPQRAELFQLGGDPGRVDHVLALAGNPNTGKSTVFNALTGMRQHTGNWPGKTVTRAEGMFAHEGRNYQLIDLPGTYSLLATSEDEVIARDFVLFGQPDATIVVLDATHLERNLNLALQVLEITDRVVICLNLMDEARRRGLQVDDAALSEELGVPVVPTVARNGEGLPRLRATIARLCAGELATAPRRVAVGDQDWAGVEQLAARLENALPGLPNAAWVARRLLDGDERIEQALVGGELARLYGLPTPSGPAERRTPHPAAVPA